MNRPSCVRGTPRLEQQPTSPRQGVTANHVPGQTGLLLATGKKKNSRRAALISETGGNIMAKRNDTAGDCNWETNANAATLPYVTCGNACCIAQTNTWGAFSIQSEKYIRALRFDSRVTQTAQIAKGKASFSEGSRPPPRKP